MQCLLIIQSETMNNEPKKRKPHRLEIPQIKPQIEVELVKTQPRYLWEMTTTQASWLWGNLGDTYYDTTLSKLKIRRETGRANVA
jgi:hypothetical protein